MTPEKSTEMYDAAVKYVKMGFVLIPLPFAKKCCYIKGWPQGKGNISTIEECEYFRDNPVSNMGVNLGFSDILIVDIDHKPSFIEFCKTYGLEELLTTSTMGIKSHRENSGKLIFHKPQEWRGRYHKVTEFGGYDGCVCEFRCGEGLQDVLPPSVHPDTGKRYELVNEECGIAELPQSVRAFWEDWDKNAYVKDHVSEKYNAYPTEYKENDYNNLQWLRERLDLRSELLEYGAEQKSSDRWVSPYSKTKTAGIYTFDDNATFYCHNQSDPNFGDGRAHNVLDVWLVNTFGKAPRNMSKSEWRAAYLKALEIRMEKENWMKIYNEIEFHNTIRG